MLAAAIAITAASAPIVATTSENVSGEAPPILVVAYPAIPPVALIMKPTTDDAVPAM